MFESLQILKHAYRKNLISIPQEAAPEEGFQSEEWDADDYDTVI
jgi:hypothetical protein